MRDKIVLAICAALVVIAALYLLPIVGLTRSPRGVLPLGSKFVLILDLGWLAEEYGHTMFECIEEVEGVVCEYLGHNPVWPRP